MEAGYGGQTMASARYGGEMVGNASLKQVESVPSILNEIEKLASELRAMSAHAADNMVGPEPEGACERPPQSSTLMNLMMDIRGKLNDAARHQRRMMNALAL